MKIKINDFKGIYTNQDTAMLPLEYCADTDCKIERGWIQARKYEIIPGSTTTSNDTILFQKEILLDQDKLKNKVDANGNLVNDYFPDYQYYDCKIVGQEITLTSTNPSKYPSPDRPFVYSGTFIKVVESDGKLTIITNSRIYHLLRVNRTTNSNRSEYLTTIVLLDITKTVYSIDDDIITIQNNTSELRTAIEVTIVANGVPDNTKSVEGIRVHNFNIVTKKDNIVVEGFKIVQYYRAGVELGFSIIPPYGNLTISESNYVWYENFAKPLLAMYDKSNPLGVSCYAIPSDTINLGGISFSNAFNHRYSPVSNDPSKSFIDTIPSRGSLYSNFGGMSDVTMNYDTNPVYQFRNNHYLYSCGKNEDTIVDHAELKSTGTLTKRLVINSTNMVIYQNVETTKWIPEEWLNGQFDYTFIDPNRGSIILPLLRENISLISKAINEKDGVFELTYRLMWYYITPGVLATKRYDYKVFADFVSSKIIGKKLWMYNPPASYAEIDNKTSVYFDEGTYLFEFTVTAIINETVEYEVKKVLISAPLSSTNYVRIKNLFVLDNAESLITRYRVYLSLNGNDKDNGRLLYEVNFNLGQIGTAFTPAVGEQFIDLLVYDLTGIYMLQTLNKPEGVKYLDLRIDDYFEFNGVPVILNRGILHYGTLGNGKYMPVFYDSNFVPGIQGRMFVYINGTLGIVDVDRIIMLSIVAQEGVLLFSKKDEVGFIVKDKYDIAETPDGVILHTRHGIFATNGQEMIPLSEPINDIVKANWEKGNIFYDTYDKELWYLISQVKDQSSGAIYIYDFNYQTWICLSKVVTDKYTTFYMDQKNQKFLVSDNKVSRVSLNNANCHIYYHPTHFNELGIKKKILGIKFDLNGELEWNGKKVKTNDREFKKLKSTISEMIPKDFIELRYKLSKGTKLYGFELTLDIEKEEDEYPV